MGFIHPQDEVYDSGEKDMDDSVGLLLPMEVYHRFTKHHIGRL